jgi:uncharacterized protein (TIGR03118 family)
MKTLLSLTTAASLALSGGSFASAQHYTQVNLVANTSGVAPLTDPNLVNPWGVSRTSGSPWWISDNGTGLSTLYNGAGAINPLVVTIPKADPTSKPFPTGTPTGTIANGSPTDFLLAAGVPAAFLFSTIDGTISGWNPAIGVASGGAPPSTHAVVVVKTTDGSSYTGLTSATINDKRYLSWCRTRPENRSPSTAFGPSVPATALPPAATTQPAHPPPSSISPPAPTTAQAASLATSNLSPPK